MRHVAIAALIIVLPVLLQAWAPISIDIAAILGTQILMAIWATRVELSRQAQAIIQQQALWLPLAHPTAFALVRKGVEGYQVSPFGRQDFSRVQLD